MLGVLSMAEIKFFYSWPLTFSAQTKKPNTKKLLQLCAWKYGHGLK